MYNSSQRDIFQLEKDKMKQQMLNIFDMTTGRKQRLNFEEFTEYSDCYLMVPIYLYIFNYILIYLTVDHCLTKHVETRIPLFFMQTINLTNTDTDKLTNKPKT